MSQTPRQQHSHIIPAKNYHMTLAALLVLMLATVGASFWQIPGNAFLSGQAMNNILAMFIAVIKATLVVMIFMGVKYQSTLVKLWAAIGFVGATLMVGILLDYFARPYENKRRWDSYAEGAMPRVRPSTEESKP